MYLSSLGLSVDRSGYAVAEEILLYCDSNCFLAMSVPERSHSLVGLSEESFGYDTAAEHF